MGINSYQFSPFQQFLASKTKQKHHIPLANCQNQSEKIKIQKEKCVEAQIEDMTHLNSWLQFLAK